MTTSRLLLAPLTAIALVSCAPDDSGEEGREGAGSRGSPLGLELAVAGTGGETDTQAATVIDLSVEELKAKIAAGNIRLIDVRRADEVAEGIIPGAEHVALDDFDPAALDLSDGREIVLYCRSGRRSGIAGEALAAHTGQPAQHLAGGILAWREAETDQDSR